MENIEKLIAPPEIRSLNEKKLVGISLKMSFTEIKTFQLWNSFMPRKKEILHPTGTAVWSLEIFPKNYFDHFDPSTIYDKWAAIEVNEFFQVPAGMQPLLVPAGKYAVFIHKGLNTEAENTYRHIFETWLPASPYKVDDRPHFAIMGDKYRKDDPSSEEEVWIPIRTSVS
jgi:AraC family transcriptional regulator